MCLAHPNSGDELGKTCATLLAAARGCQAVKIRGRWSVSGFSIYREFADLTVHLLQYVNVR
jgi:hypothetical protein